MLINAICIGWIIFEVLFLVLSTASKWAVNTNRLRKTSLLSFPFDVSCFSSAHTFVHTYECGVCTRVACVITLTSRHGGKGQARRPESVRFISLEGSKGFGQVAEGPRERSRVQWIHRQIYAFDATSCNVSTPCRVQNFLEISHYLSIAIILRVKKTTIREILLWKLTIREILLWKLDKKIVRPIGWTLNKSRIITYFTQRNFFYFHFLFVTLSLSALSFFALRVIFTKLRYFRYKLFPVRH